MCQPLIYGDAFSFLVLLALGSELCMIVMDETMGQVLTPEEVIENDLRRKPDPGMKSLQHCHRHLVSVLLYAWTAAGFLAGTVYRECCVSVEEREGAER